MRLPYGFLLTTCVLSYALSYRETSIFVKTKACNRRPKGDGANGPTLCWTPRCHACYTQVIILTPRPKDIDRQYFFSPAVETCSAFTFDSSRRSSSADPRSCSIGNSTAVSGSPRCIASV